MNQLSHTAFKHTVLQYYRSHGRHDLPWRKTAVPYRILVSEVMLQQTQVERVVPKYQAFLKAFPTVQRLAAAPLGDVLRLWQGLGYNRRAKALHECARVVVREHKGKFPQTVDELKALPGIGPYTAGAVMAFAYNQAVPLIETNVRTVYLHHFFKDDQGVTDEDILKLVEKTLDHENPREWYWALMDYGSYLKSAYGNQNVRSRSYKKQSRFQGSDRQLRGAILKALGEQNFTDKRLQSRLDDFAAERVTEQLSKLINEGLVQKKGRGYQLPA